MSQPLKDYNAEAYKELANALLAVRLPNKAKCRVLDIGSGDITEDHYLSAWINSGNWAVTCVDKIDIKVNIKKTRHVTAYSKTDINEVIVSRTTPPQELKELIALKQEKFDVIILHATLHELHHGYELPGYLTCLFSKMSCMLNEGGQLILGDYWFPEGMSLADRKLYVKTQFEETGHGDPPERFLDKEVIERYSKAFFKIKDTFSAKIYNVGKNHDFYRNYYLYVLDKKNCIEVPYFRERDRYAVQSERFYSKCEKALSNIALELIAVDGGRDGSDLKVKAYKLLSKILWGKDNGLLAQISGAVADYVYIWNAGQPDNLPSGISVWIGYESVILKNMRLLAPDDLTSKTIGAYETSNYHGYFYDFKRNSFERYPEKKDVAYVAYNRYLHKQGKTKPPSLHGWIQQHDNTVVQIVNGTGENQITEREIVICKSADGWGNSLSALDGFAKPSQYDVTLYPAFLTAVFAQGYRVMGAVNLKDRWQQDASGSLMYFTDKVLDFGLLSELKKCIQHVLSHLAELEDELKSQAASEHQRKSSIKWATSAIMARNMSHNIGSHVLNYLAKEDQFYGYLRDKMNFITEIVTSTPKWGVKMEFLTEVLLPFCGITDGLSDDEKRKFNKAQSDLLGNIFKSEITTGDAISRLKFTYKVDGKKVVDVLGGNNGIVAADLPKDWSGSFVSMPHGIISCHAFYSFMEGFIRNSAKHNRPKLNEEGLHITIELSSHDDDIYKLCVSDNISKFSNEKCESCDYARHICKSCRNYINKCIGEELTNSAGSIAGAWGLKELSMCAKWLRGISADASFSQQTPPLLKLTEKDVWELYLSKPKDVLLVGSALMDYENKNGGVYFLPDLATFEATIKENKLTHSMVVLDGGNTELLAWSKKNLLRLPQRLFIYDGKNGNGDRYISINAEDLKSGIIEGLYKALISKWFGNKTLPKIVINIGNGKGEKPLVKGDLFEFVRTHPESARIYFTHESDGLATLPENLEFAAGFSTASAVDSFYTLLRAAETDQSIQYKICEFALLKVLVVDERLFRDSLTPMELPKAGSKPLWEHWRRMGVEFATFEKAEEIKIHNQGGFIESKAFGDYTPVKFDFLSIHQALIGDVIKDKWDSVLPALGKIARNIIIHSARGDVKVLGGHKFIDYSNLRNVLIDRPDKQALAERLMSLTGEGGKQ